MSADVPTIPFSAQSLLGETNRDLTPHQQNPKPKRKRNGPGKPNPMAKVVALSPERLLATGIYVCEVCNRGFERDQNLQLHRRTHNLVGSLKKSSPHKNIKHVYVCPEPSCVHHNPSRALGDITGIKKHYIRKHCERKWKCEKCSKMYATESDMKAHFNRCSSGKFRCDKCGKVFSRKRSHVTHQKDCKVVDPDSQGVPMMPEEGANGVSNVVLALPAPNAPHPSMAPSFANFNEGMESMNWVHGGRPADMQVVDGLPMMFGEYGVLQGNMQGTLPPVPPVVNYLGDALGMRLPWYYLLLGGNASSLPSMDELAYMGWTRF